MKGCHFLFFLEKSLIFHLAAKVQEHKAQAQDGCDELGDLRQLTKLTGDQQARQQDGNSRHRGDEDVQDQRQPNGLSLFADGLSFGLVDFCACHHNFLLAKLFLFTL